MPDSRMVEEGKVQSLSSCIKREVSEHSRAAPVVDPHRGQLVARRPHTDQHSVVPIQQPDEHVERRQIGWRVQRQGLGVEEQVRANQRRH